MAIQDLQKAIRQSFTELFEKDKKIEQIYKQIRNRSATYEDAQKFAIRLGDLLNKSVKGKDFANVNLYEVADNIVGNLVNQNASLVNSVCEEIQTQMNESIGKSIKAVKPADMVERINGIKDQVIKATSNDDINKAFSMINNTVQAQVDNWVRTNYEFQRKIGLGSVVVRKWSGRRPSHDTKHTDWCEDLAGTYQYDNQGDFENSDFGVPENVWKRHEGCKCTISFYPYATSKGKITSLAKGEKDVDGILWNTGNVTSNSRKAVLQRRRRTMDRESYIKLLNEEWKGGFNGNAERHFS